ncbi:MAG: AlkA N-terminal domain-containing protein, partial [Gemmatimonadales bacterium]
LPVTEVAFASGFSSLRRFNDAFLRRYGMPPTRLRRAAEAPVPDVPAETLTLPLGYRPPFGWDALLDFLRTRVVPGVEVIAGGRYLRTVQIGAHTGWISVRNAPERRSILVELPHELTPVLPALLGRLRHLFDLQARPDLIVAVLEQDPLLAPSVARHPGLRVPGAFDGFEIMVRAVLGQQVTVATGTRLTARVVAAFGERIAGAPEGLDRLTPTAERVAGLRAAELAGLGIVRTRAACLVAVAAEVAAGRIRLEPGPMAEETVDRLLAVPGIGPWTARYVAMRALGWPDAFLTGDAVVRNRLGGLSPRLAEKRSELWRPWRSYATLHLWKRAGSE